MFVQVVHLLEVLDTCGYYKKIFFMEKLYFGFVIKWVWLGVGYFNRTGPEMYYFVSEIGLEATFF